MLCNEIVFMCMDIYVHILMNMLRGCKCNYSVSTLSIDSCDVIPSLKIVNHCNILYFRMSSKFL